jgi:hypothetical protein
MHGTTNRSFGRGKIVCRGYGLTAAAPAMMDHAYTQTNGGLGNGKKQISAINKAWACRVDEAGATQEYPIWRPHYRCPIYYRKATHHPSFSAIENNFGDRRHNLETAAA